jgi:hypothetical protein
VRRLGLLELTESAKFGFKPSNLFFQRFHQLAKFLRLILFLIELLLVAHLGFLTSFDYVDIDLFKLFNKLGQLPDRLVSLHKLFLAETTCTFLEQSVYLNLHLQYDLLVILFRHP